MKITVSRSGGFAGITRVWTVEATGRQEESFRKLVDSCPWDQAAEEDQEPDRFVYAIEAAEYSVRLSERALTEPWKRLVDQTQQADAARRQSPGSSGPG